MNREAARALLRFGAFIAFTSLILLLVIPRSSPSFVVTVMSLCVGGLMIALSVHLIRRP